MDTPPPARQLFLVVVDGPDRGARMRVDGTVRVVGRARELDLTLGDPGVSRRHLEVVATEEGVRVQTCTGAGAFLIDGAPRADAELQRGDKLVVGNTMLRVVEAGGDSLLPSSLPGQQTPVSGTEATNVNLLLTGAASDVRGLGALFDLNQALERAEDRPAIERVLADWAKRHDRVVDARLVSASDAGIPNERRQVFERSSGRETLFMVPTGMIGEGVIEFRVAAGPSPGVGDALRRLLAVAGSLCASTVARVAAMRSIELSHRALRVMAVGSAEGFLGSSAAASEVAEMIPRLAAFDSSVLLLGETGSGKSFVARLVHEASGRSREPFTVINCAAIPEALLEGELFGYERGAFTGAIASRTGALEAAGRGTLLLDEIGELTPTSQAKLLRALEERRFERIGSNRSIALGARILAATNRDIEAMADAGGFRRDLFFRISVVTVKLPSLRERRADVPALARQILRDLSSAVGRRVEDFSPAAIDVLESYAWPGNVRELRNAVEHAIVLGKGPTIEAADLPSRVRATAPSVTPEAHGPEMPLRLDELEIQAIERALAATGGNQTRAAALLGIDRVTLHNKVKKLKKPK